MTEPRTAAQAGPRTDADGLEPVTDEGRKLLAELYPMSEGWTFYGRGEVRRRIRTIERQAIEAEAARPAATLPDLRAALRTMMANLASERGHIRVTLDRAYHAVDEALAARPPAADAEQLRVAMEALTAERRATVERIRAELGSVGAMEGTAELVQRVLDEEAAR